MTSLAHRCTPVWSCNQGSLRGEAKVQCAAGEERRETELQQESLTDGCDEPVEVAVREEWLRQFSEEQLEGAGDDVHVLPLAVLQVQLLCREIQPECVSGQQGAPLQR